MRVFAWCATIFPLNRVGARVFINLDKPALGSLLILIYRVCLTFSDPALVNGKRVDFHLVDMSGSVGADVMIVDPTTPCYARRSLASAKVLSVTSMC